MKPAEFTGVSVRRFFLFSLVFLPLCFYIWHVLAPAIAIPVGWSVEKIAITFWPDLFSVMELSKAQLFVEMSMGEKEGKILPASIAGNRLGFYVETRLLTFSLPFYSALLLAIPNGSFNRHHVIGLIFILIFCIAGAVGFCLKESLILLGPGLFEESVFLPIELIVFFYQFSILIFPTLGPVLILGVIYHIEGADAESDIS